VNRALIHEGITINYQSFTGQSPRKSDTFSEKREQSTQRFYTSGARGLEEYFNHGPGAGSIPARLTEEPSDEWADAKPTMLAYAGLDAYGC
jgi:hypothetical protein